MTGVSECEFESESSFNVTISASPSWREWGGPPWSFFGIYSSVYYGVVWKNQRKRNYVSAISLLPWKNRSYNNQGSELQLYVYRNSKNHCMNVLRGQIEIDDDEDDRKKNCEWFSGRKIGTFHDLDLSKTHNNEILRIQQPRKMIATTIATDGRTFHHGKLYLVNYNFLR